MTLWITILSFCVLDEDVFVHQADIKKKNTPINTIAVLEMGYNSPDLP